MQTSYEQAALDLDVTVAEAPREPATRNYIRGSLRSMIKLALERSYATDLGDLLDQVARLRQYKPFNGLLAILQRPHATHLLPAHEWECRWRRAVLPHEHPIVLLVPHGPVTFVFDVSQTEAVEGSRILPEALLNPYAMEDVRDAGLAIATAVSAAVLDGVRVHRASRGWSHAGCIRSADGGATQSFAEDHGVRSVPVRFETLLNSSYTATEQLSTLAHELGHLYCGHLGARKTDRWPNRSNLVKATSEFEAESVARLVFRRIAPTVELPPHLDQYFRADELPDDSRWDLVSRAASRIIEMCQATTITSR